MQIKESLVELRDYTGEEYSPVLDYDKWRVAILNYADSMLPENTKDMQRHDETDEVFVLMQGKCILYIGEGDKKVEKVYSIDMEPYKVYNVKKAVWHNHTVSKDGKVLIVENRNTDDDNSPYIDLTEIQQAQIIEDTKNLWG
jgi:hypothetical protein